MNTKSILIVSHDVGGANNIAYWARELATHYQFSCYLAGPALKVFNDYVPHLPVHKEKPEFTEFDFVVTGSGWQSQFELNAIKEAKLLGVPCGAYLDHWTNYKARFRDELGAICYPDEIWVADREAYTIAQGIFSCDVHKIRFVRNRYLKQLTSDYSSHQQSKPSINLICLEPIRNEVTYEEVYGRLVAQLDTSTARLRLHPSNAPCGLELLKSLLDSKNITYEFSQSPLHVDLAESKCVYGYQSSVLVYATNLGVPTFSYYPSKEMEPILPHSSIHYL